MMAERRKRRERRRPGELSSSAGGVVKSGIVCYVLAGLLNSGSIVEIARDMPVDSTMRNSLALPLAKRLDRLATSLGFDRAATKLDRWRGISPTVSELPPTSAPPPTSEASEISVGSTSTSSTSSTPPTTPAPATTSTIAAPSRTNRLRVYAAGDSLVQGWGEALQRLTGASGVVDLPAADYRPATGLSRPDSYDWPRRLRDQLKSRNPQLVVVGFGGNDAQGIEVNGRAYQVGEDAWIKEYSNRVGSVMDLLVADDRSVIWVGTPMPSSSKDFANQDVVNRIFRDQAAARPAVTFIDTWQLFAGPDGGYSQTFDDGGTDKIVRQNDGFHLNVSGANLLAKVIFAAVAQDVAARGGSMT